MTKPHLITVTEVARLLRIRRAKVYILIECAAIEAFKVGNDWRISLGSVEKMIGPVPPEFFVPRQSEL